MFKQVRRNQIELRIEHIPETSQLTVKMRCFERLENVPK